MNETMDSGPAGGQPSLEAVLAVLEQATGAVPGAVVPEKHGRDYLACRFAMEGHRIVFRLAKATPKKAGYFVAIWRRDERSKPVPYHVEDDFDLLVVAVATTGGLGAFVFPKAVLAAKGFISGPGGRGKLGTRVYPPFTEVSNGTAESTRHWQSRFFVQVSPAGAGGRELLRLAICRTLAKTAAEKQEPPAPAGSGDDPRSGV